MKRIATALLLTATIFGAHAATPDKAVGRVLDTLKYPYEVDEDGDYKMVFDLDDGRTQLVFVRSTVEEYGKHKIREIWSPGYNAPGKQFPAAVANRLLEDSQDAKLGAWVKQDQLAMFVVKVDATAGADALSDAIDAAMRTADAMEAELTETDEY
ncbi:hypothetical protein [Stenotrophomonas sp.]|uniref:hypothetical protein n=1 Tax=Stenotrophomonas sp. TaxID=69392 RepID=UPI0028A8BF5E|nr:hypothetical protein [Stenotrophomonas sp.]